MKAKNLMLLILVAILLVVGTYWSTLRRPKTTPASIGKLLLPDFPLNDVSKIMVMSAETNVVVTKEKDGWLVTSRFNYPANFTKIAETLKDLSEMKIGQVVTCSESQRGTFKLCPPAPSATNASDQTGAQLELRDAQDRVLASLLIGKHFMRQPPSRGAANPMMAFGYPDGQYVRLSDGTVVLLSRTLDRLTEAVKTWLADDFLNAAAADIQTITITGPDRTPVTISRTNDLGSLFLEGLQESEGTVDSAKISQVSDALNHLGFDDVAAPSLTPAETGLDHPLVFTAKTRQGQIYKLNIGNTLTNDSFDRYIQVKVAYEAPAAEKKEPVEKKAADQAAKKEDKDQAVESKNDPQKIAADTQALNAKFGPWIYIIKSYRVEPMLLKRGDLIKKPEPAKETTPSTEAKPAEFPTPSVFMDQPAKAAEAKKP